MSDPRPEPDPAPNPDPERRPDPEAAPTRADLGIPDWDDEYVDRVADRLMYNYDLDDDYRVRGERFDLYGRMRVESRKHFFHPSLNYANHGSTEHLFVRRASGATRADLERLVDLGHDLAAEWIDADEEHFSTDFTFVLVVPELPEDVREFVSGFRDRTLLRFGYYGHYEVNLLVVAPEREALAASANADVAHAFRLWTPVDAPAEPTGLVDRLVGLLRREG
ncbi:hypothetical protein ACFQPA_13345 [Halomarina halobia]|uniref:DUF8052 domain-containing protein n=1 Tax=Halomarina halobia TaxID=3033386 RepID=A0ABD6A9R3_9EURY|nr:hypothetical protein [Halomarina sp. PSR21]